MEGIRMDKLLVRLLPILLNLYIIAAMTFAWAGIDISVYDYWFSCPILMGILLTVLSHTQGKYHCKWIRALCYNLIFTSSLTYIDSVYVLFETAQPYLIMLTASMSVSIITTIVLAINHFRRVRKVLKKHKYEELRPIKCNRTRKD